MSFRLATALVASALLAAGLLAPGTIAAGSSAPPTPAPNPRAVAVPGSVARTGRVLVRWAGDRSARASSAPARVRAVGRAAQVNARFVRVTASGAAVYDLGKPLGTGAPQLLDRLRRVPGVARVEQDLWMSIDGLPNDTYTNALWGLIDGSLSSAPDYGIDAPGAWRTTRGAGVVVAVIDTGILFKHPDLVGQTLPGYDMVSDDTIDNDPNPGRDPDAADPGDWCPPNASSWHGTHVAGTIAARVNNFKGVFGGAPGVRILPVRALGKCMGWSSDIADAIVWAAGGTVPGVPANTNPARVLNLSIGGQFLCPSEYIDAIGEARSRGSVVIVAAGNDNDDAINFTPANCPGVITVAAIDQAGKRASFSNYGDLVEIAGPGVGIKSTLNSGTTVPNTTSAGYIYVDYQGTSMATPHVALTAALLIAADPLLTPDEVEALLEGSARPFARDTTVTGCANRGCGAGIVNARRAIEALHDLGP